MRRLFVIPATRPASALAHGLGPLVTAVGLLAVLATAVVLIAPRPRSAATAVLGVLLVASVIKVQIRYIVGGLLLYLPFEELVLTHVPAGAVVVARYTPEAVLYAIAGLLILTRFTRFVRGAEKVAIFVGLLLVVWLSSALWNSIAASTAAIGLRAELRFLPLLAIGVLAKQPARDARLYGQLLVLGAVIQTLIALAEFAGGSGVRAWFSPQWNIVQDGVSVAASAPVGGDLVAGTFSHHNGLGIFLLFAWIVLASAGAKRLGLPRGAGVVCGAMIVGGIVLSGSRASALALLATAIVIGRIRFRMPLVYLTVLAVIAATFAASLAASGLGDRPRWGGYSGLADRWASMVGLAFESTDQSENFRLFLLNSQARLVAAESPVFGFGLGSMTDRRKLEDGTSAVYKTFAGTRAAKFSYLYDGNWGLLLVEVGIAGLAALALLFGRLAGIGLAVLREHWVGLVLVANLIAVAGLGFFAPVLQLRLPNAVLWIFAGLAICVGSKGARRPAHGP